MFSNHLALIPVLAAGTHDGPAVALGIGVVVVAVSAIIGVIYVVRRREKERTEEFRKVAEELGFAFSPEGDGPLRERLSHLHLFSQGHSRKIKNLLRGESNGVELAVFGYRYVTGHGKHARSHNQSIIYFHSAALDLPQFAVRPEGLFHKIGGVFGYQDIDFETHPHFSKTYLLRGKDEGAIREHFDDELLAFFESQREICVEGGGNQLLFYRQRKRIQPAEIQQFMESGFGIFTLFCRPRDGGSRGRQSR